jgi:putative DNA-invertase from lambdoid prophage Rac
VRNNRKPSRGRGAGELEQLGRRRANFSKKTNGVRDRAVTPLRNNAKHASLYLRVSTTEQTTINQSPELLEMMRARGCQLFATYEESRSAVGKRPEFERMMRDAHLGRFGVLLVWSLDRLGRRMSEIVDTVQRLNDAGVRVVSARESWLDVGDPTMRKLLLAVFSWVAEWERERLIARTRAGLDRVRAKGVKLGRPRARAPLHEVVRALGDGLSMRQAARRLGVGASTLYRLHPELVSQKRVAKNGR